MTEKAIKMPVIAMLAGCGLLVALAALGGSDLVREFLVGPACLENTDLLPTAIPVLPRSH